MSRQRHSRTDSAPMPAAEPLHIDTALPLQLAPVNLCSTSLPLMACPTSAWGSTSSYDDTLRRSDSTKSFFTSVSDGSWHGDIGDEDPDGQLDDAIHRSNSEYKDKWVDKILNEVYLATFDYQEDADEESFRTTDVKAASIEDDSDAAEANAIQLLAGPVMNKVASYLLEGRSLALPSTLFKSEKAATNTPLTRSHSEGQLVGSMSLGELESETHKLLLQRRQRSSTLPSASSFDRDVNLPSSKLGSLWQWLMPSVDEDTEQDFFGLSPFSTQSRNELYSISSSREF
ncbi:hypothetical protein CBS101457_000767 [Exobasidium rhododendri]|nr:hypothetical protein CBS101457_000767 [Exobasidium rhododendri]